MKKQRLFSAILCVMLLASCASNLDAGKESSNPGETSAGNGETTAAETDRWLDALPEELDLNKQTITVHVRGDAATELVAEEGNADVLNEAVWKRNHNIEERLNFTLNVYEGSGWQGYGEEVTKIRASITAGDNAWQLISGWGISIAPLAFENCFWDLTDMEHLDTGAPWWNQSAVEGLEGAGHLYYVTGDIAFQSLLGSSFVMYVNQRLAAAYDVPSIPDLVRSGTWTLDNMSSIIKDINVDLNHDGDMNEQDGYGLVTDYFNSAVTFYTAADVHQIEKRDDGYVYVSQEERLSSLMDKILPYYTREGIGSYAILDTAKQMQMFASGQALIIPRELVVAISHFRDMEDEYTIVPFPKLDEDQENYVSAAYNAAALWSIPSDNPDPDTAAAVMEALAAESYLSVTPVFFETCLQVKYARNEDTIEMLNIIRDTAFVDAETLMAGAFGSPHNIVIDLVQNKAQTVASYIERNRKKYEAAVEDLNEIFLKMGDN